MEAAIKLRDKNKCARCGSRSKLEIHHIMPRAEGGSNDPSNLITLCRRCHDYIEPLGLRTYKAVANAPIPDDDHPAARPEPETDDWRSWVYGGCHNPQLETKPR